MVNMPYKKLFEFKNWENFVAEILDFCFGFSKWSDICYHFVYHSDFIKIPLDLCGIKIYAGRMDLNVLQRT